MSDSAGWYRDPSGEHTHRYWDGAGWTDQVLQGRDNAPQTPPITAGPGNPPQPHSMPPLTQGAMVGMVGVPATPVRPRLGPGFVGLGRWLAGVLITQAAAAFALALGVSAIQILNPRSSATAAVEGGVMIIAGTSSLLYLVSIILWLIWQYQLASSSRIDPSYLARSPGWHIGSWFIPVISLWFPYQNVKDLARGVMSPVDAYGAGEWDGGVDRGIATRLLPWWWFAWLTATILERLAALSKTYGILDVIVQALDLLAAVLAALVVRAITKAAVSPPNRR